MVVFVYLAAIVLSNMSVMYFGPSSTMVNAFLFIGLDMTLRDKLHESWKGNGLAWKMTALVIVGGLISFGINSGMGAIAVASTIAFVLSGSADSIVYGALDKRNNPRKVNYSNVVSAVVDSITFPTIAFGVFLPHVVIGQVVAKVFGGYVWAKILNIK